MLLLDRRNEPIKDLNQKIKTKIKQEREKYILSKLEFDPKNGHKWKAIKQLRKDYRPNYTKFKDIRGNILTLGNKAEGMAEHLRENQWKNQKKNQ